jgi:hypothetical protein
MCLALSTQLFAQSVALPNASFEEGQRSPAHWMLEGGRGTWEDQGRTGLRSVSVTGTGEDASAWKSDSFPLAANETYRITFWTRTDPDAQSGCITSGTSFVNRDYQAGPNWEKKTFIFKNPKDVSGGFVKFGQWRKKGKAWLDDVEIHKVMPHHLKNNGVELGSDESIANGTYRFRTRLASECSNYSRTEVAHTAGFNSDRWCFGEGQYVLYKFGAGAYSQTEANLKFVVNHYVKGECLVEASTDGKVWNALGRFNNLGTHEVALPAKLFPADAVQVKFTGTGNFQINSIRYEAKLSGTPPGLVGGTWFIEPIETVKNLDPEVLTLGDLLPGGQNEAVCRITNRDFWGRKIVVTLEAGRDDEKAVSSVKEVALPGHSRTTLAMGYTLRGIGLQYARLTVADPKTGKTLLTATKSRTLAAIHDASYGYRLLDHGNLRLWWAEATYKVGRTRPLPTRLMSISISAARNEYEPFQLVLSPTKELRGVSVRVGDLACGKSAIKSSNVRIETVEYIPVEIPTDSFGCAGEWPDPLAPYEKPINLAANKNQPIWFTVYVPQEAQPGRYTGNIEITVPGAPTLGVPLMVNVRNFTLPKETHTKTAYGVSVPSNFLALKTPEDRAQAHDLYMRNCAEHRISPYSPMALAPWKQTLSGPPDNPTVTLDFTEFDKAAHRYLDEFKFNAFNFGGIPGQINKFKRFTPEFNALFAKIYGPITEHLREKGWLEKAYCYWFDEPEPKDYQTVVEGMKLLKQACPGLQRLLTEQPEPELCDAVDIWVPVLSNYDPVRCHERQRAGQQVWWYVCCEPRAPYPNNFIDHPAINHRIRFWMMQKYGVTGSLYWATTYYHGAKGVLRNPWTSGMSYSPVGCMWGNGDGMLLYPPVREPAKTPTIKGPYNSIRWEMLREGLEDREYFWLLEQAGALAEKKLETASPDDRRTLEQLIGEAREALNFPDSFIADLTHYTKDPQDLYAARAKIAEYIERLGRQK